MALDPVQASYQRDSCSSQLGVRGTRRLPDADGGKASAWSLVKSVLQPMQGPDMQTPGWHRGLCTSALRQGLIKSQVSPQVATFSCNSTCSSCWAGGNSDIRRRETSRQGWTERKEIPLSKYTVRRFQVGTLFPGTGGCAVSYLKVLMISQVGFLSRKRGVLLILPIPGLTFIFKCLLDFRRSQRGQFQCNTSKCMRCELY